MPFPVITLDDSAFPAPDTLTTFADIENASAFRNESGLYFYKLNASQGVPVTGGPAVSIPTEEHVQPVSVQVFILPPTMPAA